MWIDTKSKTVPATGATGPCNRLLQMGTAAGCLPGVIDSGTHFSSSPNSGLLTLLAGAVVVGGILWGGMPRWFSQRGVAQALPPAQQPRHTPAVVASVAHRPTSMLDKARQELGRLEQQLTAHRRNGSGGHYQSPEYRRRERTLETRIDGLDELIARLAKPLTARQRAECTVQWCTIAITQPLSGTKQAQQSILAQRRRDLHDAKQALARVSRRQGTAEVS